ncbi:hypothetical protein SK128_002524 [Halocaridina rubra]|uniref:Uncharacterized protein n=1 Tax=Halocaridina rubra TaxID=373956 RepID=A0AAN9A4V3_HALRR
MELDKPLPPIYFSWLLLHMGIMMVESILIRNQEEIPSHSDNSKPYFLPRPETFIPNYQPFVVKTHSRTSKSSTLGSTSVGTNRHTWNYPSEVPGSPQKIYATISSSKLKRHHLTDLGINSKSINVARASLRSTPAAKKPIRRAANSFPNIQKERKYRTTSTFKCSIDEAAKLEYQLCRKLDPGDGDLSARSTQEVEKINVLDMRRSHQPRSIQCFEHCY